MDVLNFLGEADYNIFLALTGVWYRSFPHLSSYKVLMNSFGHIAGEAASLPLSGPCTPPHPWPPPSASASAPSVRANFLSELCSLRPPRTQTPLTSVQGDPKSPSRSPVPLSLLSRSLAPPLSKMVGEAARRRLETRRMVAHLQVIRSSLSRAPAEW